MNEKCPARRIELDIIDSISNSIGESKIPKLCFQCINNASSKNTTRNTVTDEYDTASANVKEWLGHDVELDDVDKWQRTELGYPGAGLSRIALIESGFDIGHGEDIVSYSERMTFDCDMETED